MSGERVPQRIKRQVGLASSRVSLMNCVVSVSLHAALHPTYTYALWSFAR